MLNLGGLITTSMSDQGVSLRMFAELAGIPRTLLSNAICYHVRVRIPPAVLPRIAAVSGFSLTMLIKAAENEAIVSKVVTPAAQEDLCAEIARLHLIPEGDSKCRLASTNEASRHFGRWLNHVWGAHPLRSPKENPRCPRQALTSAPIAAQRASYTSAVVRSGRQGCLCAKTGRTT